MFQEMDDDDDMAGIQVSTDIGEMNITASNNTKDIHMQEENAEGDLDGQAILQHQWLDSFTLSGDNPQPVEYEWFSAKVHKDVFKKIQVQEEVKVKAAEEVEDKDEQDTQEKEEYQKNRILNSSIPIRARGSFRGRGRGRGTRGASFVDVSDRSPPVQPRAMNNFESVKSAGSSSNSDMQSRSRKSSDSSSLSIEEGRQRE